MLSAALDAGTAFMGVVLFFCLQNEGRRRESPFMAAPFYLTMSLISNMKIITCNENLNSNYITVLLQIRGRNDISRTFIVIQNVDFPMPFFPTYTLDYYINYTRNQTAVDIQFRLPLYRLVEHHRHVFGEEPIGRTERHN